MKVQDMFNNQWRKYQNYSKEFQNLVDVIVCYNVHIKLSYNAKNYASPGENFFKITVPNSSGNCSAIDVAKILQKDLLFYISHDEITQINLPIARICDCDYPDVVHLRFNAGRTWNETLIESYLSPHFQDIDRAVKIRKSMLRQLEERMSDTTTDNRLSYRL
jgi:hypothetical protein